MVARKRGGGAARTIVRLSLPVICTVALSGAGLSSALAFEAPQDAGGQYGSSANDGNGGDSSGNTNGGGGATGYVGGSDIGGGSDTGGSGGSGMGTDGGTTGGNSGNTSAGTSGNGATGTSTAGGSDVGAGGNAGGNGNADNNDKNDTGGSTSTGGASNANAGQNDGNESKGGDAGGSDKEVNNSNDADGGSKLGLGSSRMMLGAPAVGGGDVSGENNNTGNVNGEGGAEAGKNVAGEVGESGGSDVENDGTAGDGNEGVGNQAGGTDGEDGQGTGEDDVPQMRMMFSTFAATNGGAGDGSGQQERVSYDYNAGLYSEVVRDGKPYAGVYETQVKQNADGGTETTVDNGGKYVEAAKQDTIGMPSIADKNLPDKPTTESPAIIVGAAVGYEEKTGAVEYKTNKERDAPYSEFKWNIVDEKKPEDKTSHKKLTGYDGTYVVVRLDVSDFFSATGLDGAYLHVKQENNNTLLAATGMVNVTDGLKVTGPMEADGTTPVKKGNTFTGIPNANNQSGSGKEGQTEGELTWNDASAKNTTVIRTGSYKLTDLLDPSAKTPYLDILVFATASNVAGADVGTTGALNGDIPISIYVDKVADYRPELTYDPTSQDVYHIANCLGKFYDATEAAKSAASDVIKISKYLVKGSDLALETMVKNSDETGKETTYWSLSKSFEKSNYDQPIDKSANDQGSGRTVSLMSEVAVTNDLKLEGTDANNLRKRTLDVNSFDVQVAHNTGEQKDKPKVSFGLTNAWLTIADYSNTTGAELAIGNNSQFVIDQGGRLIIDKTCQLEVEWDGATAQANTNTGNNTQQETAILNNGFLDLRRGGTVVNNGIITIEGTEGKPYQPGQEQQATTSEKGYGELLVREGATLINNGALMVYGKLYNLGTIENNGSFNDTIVSNDPDRGQFSYHKGIQVSWKDDVRQSGVVPGELVNGMDKANNTVPTATLVNRGDILLVPGTLTNHGVIDNRRFAHILEAPVSDVIIPREPPQPTDPAYIRMTVKEAFKDKDPNKEYEDSHINNFGTIVNRGVIATAKVVLNDDTSFGAMTIGALPERFNFKNDATATLTNYGYIPGYPTELEPMPMPAPAPTPGLMPYDPWSIGGGSSDSSAGSDGGGGAGGSLVTSDSPSQSAGDVKGVIHRAGTESGAAQPTAGRVLTNGAMSATITQTGGGAASGTVRVVADPVVTEIADGVYDVVSMPEIDVEALVADEPDHTVDDVESVWWCVYVDGELVRVMDIHGHLAPGIARIVWADDADLARATLVGVELGDGTVVYLTPDTELFLEVLWS